MNATQTRPLSAKQQRMIDYIWAYWRENHYAPSYREMQEDCDISSLSVLVYNLLKLERLGMVKVGNVSRSVIPIGDHCPCCGQRT
jgi:SOS-response transcriptional repressor LexA